MRRSMRIQRVVSGLAVLLAGACCVGPAGAEVVFLANFDTGTDADFSLASKQAAVSGGAAPTAAGQGYPFVGEPAGREISGTRQGRGEWW